MRLFLVRWQNLSLSLVHAADDDALVKIIGDVADPSEVRWWRCRQPFVIDFVLAPRGADARAPGEDPAADAEHVVNEGLTAGAIDAWLRSDVPQNDELAEWAVQKALPHVFAVLDVARGVAGVESPGGAETLAAVVDALDAEASEQPAGGRVDPVE